MCEAVSQYMCAGTFLELKIPEEEFYWLVFLRSCMLKHQEFETGGSIEKESRYSYTYEYT